MIQLVPIRQFLKENGDLTSYPECMEVLHMTLEYYKVIGYHPPWIGYFAKMGNEIVGSAGYKGRPVENKIEIAYGTFPAFQNKGIGSGICRELVVLALSCDPQVTVTARTLPENNFSSRILERNGFRLLGTVWDKDDGNVWEWEYVKPGASQ